MAAPKGNKFAEGLTDSGRPPIYSNDENGFQQYKETIVDFFNTCNETNTKATITGLALHLGFSSRGTLNEYAKKIVFSDITKRAMLTVENSYELSATTFDMFALKNMGWKDRTEVTQIFNDVTPLTEAERKKGQDIAKKLDGEY